MSNRQQRRPRLGSCLVAVTATLLPAFFSAAVFGQDLDSADSRLIAERPDPAGTPTVVELGLYLIDIVEIDDVDQTFSIDLFYSINWQDDRLALPESERNGQIRSVPIGKIWNPRGLIINDRGMSARLPEIALVDSAGKVVYEQRLYGQLAADLHFKDFPFDTQRLPIDVISYRYNPQEVALVETDEMQGDPENFSAEGWKFSINETDIGEFVVQATGTTLPRFTASVQAVRNGQYYVLTMFIPMSLVVFMSWTAFWIQPNVVPPRIAIVTGAIFSLIAFGFSIRLSLPRVSYITRADMFVLGCTLLVFIALSVAVIGSRWAGQDKLEQAVRLNTRARRIYVVLFLLVVTISLTV